jgi:hypothetical protein
VLGALAGPGRECIEPLQFGLNGASVQAGGGSKNKCAVENRIRKVMRLVLEFPKLTALAPEGKPIPRATRRNLLASACALNPGVVVVLYYREDLKDIVGRSQCC